MNMCATAKSKLLHHEAIRTLQTTIAQTDSKTKIKESITRNIHFAC